VQNTNNDSETATEHALDELENTVEPHVNMNNEPNEPMSADPPRIPTTTRIQPEIDPMNIVGELGTRTLRQRSHIAFLVYQDGQKLPRSAREALNGPERDQWKHAIDEEMRSLTNFQVFSTLTEHLPEGEKAIPSKWVFTKKADMVGNYLKHKARLVGMGCYQKTDPNIETASFVLKFKTLRILIKLASQNNWKIYQDDVKSAFLHAKLQKPTWIRLPDGTYGLLQRALYGLTEANRDWYEELKGFMIQNNFKVSVSDPCLFIRSDLLVGIYVDDTIITDLPDAVDKFRKLLAKQYTMNEQSSLADMYLGLEITQTNEGIYLSQQQYIKQKLDEFSAHIGLQKCVSNPLVHNFQELLLQAEVSDVIEPLFPYRKMVGSLMYMMVGTRFDIAAAVSIVSRYLDKPKKIHCDMVRRIFWYLRGSLQNRLFYSRSSVTLQGYVDSSYANLENFASLSGYAFTIGGSIISWNSSRQPIIALSTAESEYIALTPAIQEAIWLKQLLEELGHPQGCIPIFEDNQACILLTKNPQDHKKTRHIQIRYHWVRQQLSNKVFDLKYCDSKSQLADLFTKGLFGPSLREQSHRLGMRVMHCRKGVRNKPCITVTGSVTTPTP
jgi:hypothetical protein